MSWHLVCLSNLSMTTPSSVPDRGNSTLEHHEFAQSHAQQMETLGYLAVGIAHDFNNLLTVITCCTQLVLQELAEDHPSHADLREIERAARSAARLTNQLIAFGRRKRLPPLKTDLRSVLHDLEAMLKRVVGEQITLVVEVAEDLASVMIDRGEFEQIIMNLVVNARHAMPKGGRLFIRARNTTMDFGTRTVEKENASPHAGRNPICIAVSDTGHGMDEATLARAFEPFFTTRLASGGTGVGLQAIRAIVERAAGHVEVQSSPGKGTTFRIYLPTESADLHSALKPVHDRAATEDDNNTPVVASQDESHSDADGTVA